MNSILWNIPWVYWSRNSFIMFKKACQHIPPQTTSSSPYFHLYLPSVLIIFFQGSTDQVTGTKLLWQMSHVSKRLHQVPISGLWHHTGTYVRMTASIFYTEHGGSVLFENVGTYLPIYLPIKPTTQCHTPANYIMNNHTAVKISDLPQTKSGFPTVYPIIHL